MPEINKKLLLDNKYSTKNSEYTVAVSPTARGLKKKGINTSYKFVAYVPPNRATQLYKGLTEKTITLETLNQEPWYSKAGGRLVYANSALEKGVSSVIISIEQIKPKTLEKKAESEVLPQFSEISEEISSDIASKIQKELHYTPPKVVPDRTDRTYGVEEEEKKPIPAKPIAPITTPNKSIITKRSKWYFFNPKNWFKK